VEELRAALRKTHFWAHPPHREWLTDRTLLRFLIAVRAVLLLCVCMRVSVVCRPFPSLAISTDPVTKSNQPTTLQREFNVDKALEMLHMALTWRGLRCVPSLGPP